MQAMVSQYSWFFVVAMFAVSVFVKSRTATLRQNFRFLLYSRCFLSLTKGYDLISIYSI